jgi:hypothetical protein
LKKLKRKRNSGRFYAQRKELLLLMCNRDPALPPLTDTYGPRPYDFMKGFTNKRAPQYMNIGYIVSPYPGKTGEGDYGPRQGGNVYYRPSNPVYPYPMDLYGRACYYTDINNPY